MANRRVSVKRKPARDAVSCLPEGLNNIVKHADASAVTLQGWLQDERLMLVIEDDGSGLPPGSGQQGFGLTGMRERVTALGGTLTISCLHGTRVSVSLPQRYV